MLILSDNFMLILNGTQHLRIAETWPWRHELTDAFARLTALPRPAT